MRLKVLDACAGLFSLVAVGVGVQVVSRLTDFKDIACYSTEAQAWVGLHDGVTVRREGEYLVLRKGFPPRVVARYHHSLICLDVLTGLRT